MTRRNDHAKDDRIGALLGASKPKSVPYGHAPWDLYELLDSLKSEVQTGKKGGRPTNGNWKIRRLVGFRTRTWKKLQRLSKETSVEGTQVSPAQIAAFLIENSLKETK